MFLIAILFVAQLHFTNPTPAATIHQTHQKPVATFNLAPVNSVPVCVQACNEPNVQAATNSAFILQ